MYPNRQKKNILKKRKTSNTEDFFFNTIMIIIFFNTCNFLTIPYTWKIDYVFSTVKSFGRIFLLRC